MEWHPDCSNFTLRKMLLCIIMGVILHLDGWHFILVSLLTFLEAKTPIDFFLILNELHSAAENFTFLTKTNYIPYENTLHSLQEYTSFS